MVPWLGAATIVFASGCSDAVQMTQETTTGGVVTYLFKQDRGGPMGSPHRRDALRMIEKKCPEGYTVVRDGEVKGYASMSSVEGEEGDITGRRWGIQFRCK
ncbi:hypothetical protein W02_01620 [Nitrospira sp. KM1]|nr:hypothetical protein W02_01620 [Nitrospira sp. KM1]